MKTQTRVRDEKNLKTSVDEVVDRFISSKQIVGTSIVIVKDGSVIYSRAAGWADLEAKRSMQLNSIYRLASVSKLFISVAVMALVHQGKLKLNDPVTKWIPDFNPPSPEGISEITIQHLLTHMSGLGYGFFEPTTGPYHQAQVSDGMDLSELTLEQNIHRIGKAPLAFKPGTSWGYSLATDVLGYVIELVTNLKLSEAVKALVTEPLKITDTGFDVIDLDRFTTAYSGYNRMNDQLEVIPLWEGVDGVRLSPHRALSANQFPSGGAGLVGTIEDTCKLLEALRTGGGPIVSPQLVSEMTQDYAEGLDLMPWPGRGFGLGFTVLRDPAVADFPESPGTWRMGGVYGNSWSVDPSEKLTVVAFTNSGLVGQSPGGAFPHALSKAIYEIGE